MSCCRGCIDDSGSRWMTGPRRIREHKRARRGGFRMSGCFPGMVGGAHTVQLQVDGEGAYHGLVKRCMVRKIVVMRTKGLCLRWWMWTSLV